MSNLHLAIEIRTVGILCKRLCNAWLNSTCYHPPGILSLFGGLFPAPGYEERDDSPPLRLPFVSKQKEISDTPESLENIS